MRSKNFDEFIRIGIVKKQTPDKSRGNFLIKESEKNFSYLLELIKKIKIDDISANNYVKICYDIIMGLIRAKMFFDGYKTSGFRAHEVEVTYFEKIGFPEKDVLFLDKMRYYRNGILYYGTIINEEYTQKVIDFTKKIYHTLKEAVDR
ncbi:MAG: hypothetical protein WC260_02085 [Candidatus Pacearchaeota archaeon]